MAKKAKQHASNGHVQYAHDQFDPWTPITMFLSLFLTLCLCTKLFSHITFRNDSLSQ